MASRTRSRARIIGLAACALLALSPAAASANVLDTYYEHALMSAADGRCHLFTPALSSAINVAQILARNAALRAGVDEDQVNQKRDRAVGRAAIEPCNSADLALVAKRERNAFEVYSRLQSVSYKGDFKTWFAVRQASTTGRVWNLSQSTDFGHDNLTFGSTGSHGSSELVTVVQFADRATPFAVQLVMRDRAKSPRPVLDQRKAGPGGLIPLSGRVTPRSATVAFLADSKFAPDRLIQPAGKTPAVAYRFPAAAAGVLAGLDPREAVEIDFLFSGPGGDQARIAYIEVGDFAAGRAFLAPT